VCVKVKRNWIVTQRTVLGRAVMIALARLARKIKTSSDKNELRWLNPLRLAASVKRPRT